MLKLPISRNSKPKILQLAKPLDVLKCHELKQSTSKINKLKSKRAKPKIKDYMITETPLILTKANLDLDTTTLSLFNAKKIANIINPHGLSHTTTTVPISCIDKNNTVNIQNKAKHIKMITSRKLPVNFAISESAAKMANLSPAKSTIKEYLQSRIINIQSSKCSRAKLIKNKENLLAIKN